MEQHAQGTCGAGNALLRSPVRDLHIASVSYSCTIYLSFVLAAWASLTLSTTPGVSSLRGTSVVVDMCLECRSVQQLAQVKHTTTS